MLHERGDEVTVMSRSPDKHHPSSNIPTITADIGDRDALAKALTGADVVFHVAAKIGVWGPREEFWKVNVEGTENVLAACRKNAVRRLVYTSTPSVVFDRGDLCNVDESQPYARRFLCDYAETKAIAEQRVRAANGAELATVALRPHLIWGPEDPHLLPRVIEQARRGQLRQVGDGENLVDVTYIDNAAVAHLNAADSLGADAPSAGRAYFITNGEPVRIWPWLNELLVRIGVPPVKRRISLPTAYRVGAMLEFVHQLFHREKEPRMTRFVALQLGKSHYFSIAAAHRDLAYLPVVSMQEGLNRWQAWFFKNRACGGRDGGFAR
jgi:nucleoside-diphosphate-sugar epimerase